MVEKKKVGIFLPAELVAQYDALAKTLKGNEKWLVASAAFISLLRLPEHERYDLFGKIKAADLPGRSLRDLIAEAKGVGARDDRPVHNDNAELLDKLADKRGKLKRAPTPKDAVRN